MREEDNSVFSSDGQTSENQTGSVACGVCLSFTAGCLVVWDFSTALEMTVALPDSQIKESTIKIFLIDNVENSAD